MGMTRGGAGSVTATRTRLPSTAPRRTTPRPPRATSIGPTSGLMGRCIARCGWPSGRGSTSARVFLQPLLMRADTTRTVAVCMELVGPAKAIRKAERAMTEAATEDSLRGADRAAHQPAPASARARRRPPGGASSPKATPTSATAPTSPSASRTPARDARDELEAAVSRVDLQAKAAPLRLERMWGQQALGAHLRAPALPGAEMSSRRAARGRTRNDERRARGLRRDRSQPPIARSGPVARCRASDPATRRPTAHFQAVYPAVAEAGLGARGRLHRPRHARRQLRL